MALETMEQIEQAITQLAPQQLQALYQRLDRNHPQTLDARIEFDLAAGRIDNAIDRLKRTSKRSCSVTMTITLEIKAAVQAELARQAAASGCPLEAYAASLLEEAMHLPSTGKANQELPTQGLGRKLVDVCAMVAGLTDDVDCSRSPSTWRPLDLS